MNNAVTSNIVKKMGQTTQSGMAEGITQEPGTLSDSLTTALKSLLNYSKLASQQNPDDPDIKLVRRMVQALSFLVAKDQQEGQGSAEQQGVPQSPDQGMMGGGMGQGSVMGGMGGGMQPPEMPDLSSILGKQG